MSDEDKTDEVFLEIATAEDEGFHAFVSTLKAARALVLTAEAFHLSADDSPLEQFSEAQLDLMIKQMLDNPEKATEMFHSLLALIVHLKTGGSFQDWFSAAGIAPYPHEKES